MDAAASEYALKAFRQWAKRIANTVGAEPHEYDEVPDRVEALAARVQDLEQVKDRAEALLASTDLSSHPEAGRLQEAIRALDVEAPAGAK